MFVTYDEDSDFTVVPTFPPGEQVRDQQCQTSRKNRNTEAKKKEPIEISVSQSGMDEDFPQLELRE